MVKNNSKYSLLVEDGKEVSKIPLSCYAISSIATDLTDHKDNTKYFSILSHHPSVDVRTNIAQKEKIDNETALRLAKDSSISVIRVISSNSVFKKIATIDMLEKFIKLDEEVARNIAYNISGYSECDIDKIVELLIQTESPETIYNLASNSDLPKKHLKNLSNHPDPKVAIEAKYRLENN
jgi:hypothetical protein